MTEARKDFYEREHERFARNKKFDDAIRLIKVDKPKIINPDVPFYGGGKRKFN